MKINKKTAQRIVNENINYISQGLASIVNIFDPEVIIITGGGKYNGYTYLKRIRKNMKKYIILPKITPVLYSRLNNSGILGASMLV